MSFEWPKTCSVCGGPGKRIRRGVWAHAHVNPNASGPSVHSFVPDVPEYEDRVDQELKDRQFLRRWHRDEVRESEGFEREVGR